jgi:hypothetical protein
MGKSFLLDHFDGAGEKEVFPQDLEAWGLRVVHQQKIEVLKCFTKVLLFDQLLGFGQNHLLVEGDLFDIFPEDFVATGREKQYRYLEFVCVFGCRRHTAIGNLHRGNFDAPACRFGLEGDDVKRLFVEQGRDYLYLLKNFVIVVLRSRRGAECRGDDNGYET